MSVSSESYIYNITRVMLTVTTTIDLTVNQLAGTTVPLYEESDTE